MSDIIVECDRLALRLGPKNDRDGERVVMDIIRDLVAVVEQLDVAAAEASLQQLAAIDVAGDGSRRQGTRRRRSPRRKQSLSPPATLASGTSGVDSG
jgi:hypothetical protein